MQRFRCLHEATRQSLTAVRHRKSAYQRSNFSSLSSRSSVTASFTISIPHARTRPPCCNISYHQPLTRRFASTGSSTDPSINLTPIAEPEFNPTDSLQSIDPYGSEVYKVDEHVGFLKELGLDYGWGPTSLVQWALEHCYLYSGLSWGTTIVVLTLAFRLGMVKLMMNASDNAARMAEAKTKSTDIDARLKEATLNGDMRQRMMVGEERRLLMQAHGVKFARAFTPILVQMPIGVGSFRLLRGMGALPMPGFEDAGFLWFQDLSLSDPYCVLPVTAACCYALSFQFNTRSGLMPAPSPATRVILQGILPAFAFAVGLFMPAGLQMSFCITGFVQMTQTYLFSEKWFREIFGLYPIPKKSVKEAPSPRILNVQGRVMKAAKEEERAPDGMLPKLQWNAAKSYKDFSKSVEDLSKMVTGGSKGNAKSRAKKNKRK